jgi:hypothetical protein
MNPLNRIPKGKHLPLARNLMPILDINAREFYNLSSEYNFFDDLSSKNKKPKISLKQVFLTRKT